MNYTWSRFAHNAVAHIATGRDQMPLCGARLNPERQIVVAENGGLHRLAKLCARCQKLSDRRSRS